MAQKNDVRTVVHPLSKETKTQHYEVHDTL